MSQTKVARAFPKVTNKKKKSSVGPKIKGDALPAAGYRDRSMVFDWLERVLVLGFYAWLMVRLVRAFMDTGSWACGILMVSEGLVVFLLVTRRPARSITFSPGAWLVCMGATLSPMLTNPGGMGFGFPGFGEAILVTGALVQLFAKVVLGRSFGLVAAHRGLKLTGPYRLVRHPMYAGYFLCHLGFLVLNPTLWNLGVYALCYSLQIPRLLIEEKHLGHDPCYREYQAEVPYRLIPGVF